MGYKYCDIATIILIYTRDAMYLNTEIIATREWCSFGSLIFNAWIGGLATLLASDNWLGGMYWSFATLCDAIDILSQFIAIRPCQLYTGLWNGIALSGLSTLYCSHGVGHVYWNVATRLYFVTLFI